MSFLGGKIRTADLCSEFSVENAEYRQPWIIFIDAKNPSTTMPYQFAADADQVADDLSNPFSCGVCFYREKCGFLQRPLSDKPQRVEGHHRQTQDERVYLHLP